MVEIAWQTLLQIIFNDFLRVLRTLETPSENLINLVLRQNRLVDSSVQREDPSTNSPVPPLVLQIDQVDLYVVEVDLLEVRRQDVRPIFENLLDFSIFKVMEDVVSHERRKFE